MDETMMVIIMETNISGCLHHYYHYIHYMVITISISTAASLPLLSPQRYTKPLVIYPASVRHDMGTEDVVILQSAESWKSFASHGASDTYETC